MHRAPTLILLTPAACSSPIVCAESLSPITTLIGLSIAEHTVCHKGFDMSRVPALNSPYLLGFDDIERALNQVAPDKALVIVETTALSSQVVGQG